MKRQAKQNLEQIRSELQTTLEKLFEAIQQRIIEEQQTNQLTGLPNLPALEYWLREQIAQANNCWVALVEVDGFKGINQQFGYELADELLLDIAQTLQTSSGEAAAYHAHGDEFYLAGLLPTPQESAHEKVEEQLNLVRLKISEIEKASDKGTMKCTVSIGWTSLEDAQKIEGVLPDAGFTMRLAEDANKTAKSEGKNRVKRWDPNIKVPPMVDPRVTCKNTSCGAVITIMVPANHWNQGGLPMTCPNCKATIERPFVERRDPKWNAAKAPAKERRGAKVTTPKKPTTKKTSAKKTTQQKK